MTDEQFTDLFKKAGIDPPPDDYTPDWLWATAHWLTLQSTSRLLSAAEVKVLAAIMTEGICFERAVELLELQETQ